jgi:hypothetical protein
MELLTRVLHRAQDLLMRYIVLPCLLALLVLAVGVKVWRFVDGWLSLWAEVGAGSWELVTVVACPAMRLLAALFHATVLPVVRAFFAFGPLLVAFL